MSKIVQRFLCLGGLFFLLSISQVWAQTELSGTVTDTNGDPIPGVGVGVQNTVFGTITDQDGKFSLKTTSAPPFKLVFSFVGYASQELEITGSQADIAIKMSDETVIGEEVVLGASRVPENIMKSPVTIEKMDIISVQQSATPDFYDGISRLKGVQATNGSLTFTSYNTRGFGTVANTRFVQMIDGMDNASPVLNFPTGNIVGISDLDVEGVELVPGAASALYGPNAFNGILMMTSKNPFDYQGLAVTGKVGVTDSQTADDLGTKHGTRPYRNFAIRYAKAFNNRFAFKVNFSILDAHDWRGNDYRGFRTTQSNYGNPNNPTYGSPDFDGVHMYGDEANIKFANLGANQQNLINAIALNVAQGSPFTQSALLNVLPNLFKDISVNRTGFREELIVDNMEAKSVKADAAVHYRINEKMELSYNYRYGTGNTIYQGGERYALRQFSVQFHKLELKAKNYFVRAYASFTDDGNSYNTSALGTFANERLAPTTTSWLPTYLGNYVGALLQQNSQILGGTAPTATQMANAHRAARTAADAIGAGRPAEGSAEMRQLMANVRGDNFKRPLPGAGFTDDSRFYHAEFNYNFAEKIEFMELQVGGNFRRYDLFTDNTIYNEVVSGDNKYQRLGINEFGVYAQASKSLLEEALKITASIRYDKNQRFKGQVNPRISAVYSVGERKEHNIRASFQTGFRNPDTQAQFIFFPSSSGTLLGGTESNAAQFGIFNGGAVDSKGNEVNMRYIQPERLSAIEVGYKGVIAKKLMVDANVYYNMYKNFINQQTVFAKNGGTSPAFISPTNPTGTFAAGTAFRPYFNTDFGITSLGAGLGLSYRFDKGYMATANYSYASFNADDAPSTYENQFNTPTNKFTLGVSNRNVWKNFGFDAGYRWQQSYLWQSAFGVGDVPAFGVFDAQINYKAKEAKMMFKIGANNLFGKDYQSFFAGPWIGRLYYLSITFDEFLR